MRVIRSATNVRREGPSMSPLFRPMASDEEKRMMCTLTIARNAPLAALFLSYPANAHRFKV